MLVFDATPLIYLAKADAVEHLENLEREKVIPEKVYSEVVEDGLANAEPDAKRIENSVENGVFQVEGINIGDFLAENDSLTDADIQVLKTAREKEAVAVMDEAYGRKVAEVENIDTRGTAFIVLELVKKESITKDRAEEIIDDMVEAGWYCSTDLYKEITKKIEEVS